MRLMANVPQLDERRRGEQTFLDHLFDEPEIAGVEDLQFRLDAEVLADARTLAQIIRGRYVGAVAVAEIQAAAVQRRDVGTVEAFMTEIDDMAHAIFLTDKIAARSGGVLQSVVAD